MPSHPHGEQESKPLTSFHSPPKNRPARPVIGSLGDLQGKLFGKRSTEALEARNRIFTPSNEFNAGDITAEKARKAKEAEDERIAKEADAKAKEKEEEEKAEVPDDKTGTKGTRRSRARDKNSSAPSNRLAISTGDEFANSTGIQTFSLGTPTQHRLHQLMSPISRRTERNITLQDRPWTAAPLVIEEKRVSLNELIRWDAAVASNTGKLGAKMPDRLAARVRTPGSPKRRGGARSPQSQGSARGTDGAGADEGALLEGVPATAFFAEEEEAGTPIKEEDLKRVIFDASMSNIQNPHKIWSILGDTRLVPSARTMRLRADVEKPYAVSARDKDARGVVLMAPHKLATLGMVILVNPLSNLFGNKCVLIIEFKAMDSKRKTTKIQWAQGNGNGYGMGVSIQVDPSAGFQRDVELAAQDGRQVRTFPGFNGRAPIWVPAQRCTISLVVQDAEAIARRAKDNAKFGSSRPGTGPESRPNSARSVASVESVMSTSSAVDAGGDPVREHSSHGRRRKPRRVIVDPLAPPVSADLLVFSAETPQDAILLLRRLQDNNFKKALNTLSVGSIPAVVAAAQHGNVEALAELLQKGASIHSLRDDISRLTPLHEAVRHGHSHLTRFLLSQGAHQSYVDQAGHTPLHLACINGDVECIRALSADKSQARFKNALGCEDKNRRKPHHSCSNSYCEAIVEDLMRKLNLAVRPVRKSLS